ncbi:transport permease protein [Actinoplanes cyaneus]|uniref:Transport permease protein n=1 Tax=Actinoplanes cyaneus TaxID=52696 RepID=A0A919I9X9_9ACTN|nr:ABC transporter permease [Actinoplanes cyaneus]MCW2142642.1 lipooligosaccharide transport system permease protein [Actinoplanes cyaneus]GID62190.1 transport permease protein [Actinoplanes cyaneus]
MSAAVLVERNLMIYKHTWYVLLAEIFEPILYLLSIGVGIGVLVGSVTGVTGGSPVRYAAFVAPALLATAAMNGAMNETTFLMFGKLKTDRTYESMLATPLSERDVALGEIAWAVLRGTLVSLAFLAVITALGLVESPWAILVVPGAALIAFAFATAGVVVVTFLRDWQDMQYIQLVMLPMFLFATTFYPLSVYPRPVQLVVQWLPLYQSIELLRNPALGVLSPRILVAAVYLAAMGALCLTVAVRRLGRTLAA